MNPDHKNFFQKVYEIARQIPYGRVTSYGAIAKYLGAARSARMVGWAMNSSLALHDVPAHRVVNRKGLLTGKHHFEGPISCNSCWKAKASKLLIIRLWILKIIFGTLGKNFLQRSDSFACS